MTCTRVRKHPAPEGALRRFSPLRSSLWDHRQKAPSTRRCIKTSLSSLSQGGTHVRKHPAPEGALRRAASHRWCSSSCQKAPSTRRCIKTRHVGLSLWYGNIVRKHPAPEGALRHHADQFECLGVSASEGTRHRKACSRELPCGGCQQRRKTVSPTASPLNRPSEPTRTTPPPQAPPSSTTTKASTPGGFVPGELAGFQQASRNRNASTAGTGQQTQSQAGRAKEPSRLLVARSRDAVNASADQHPCPTPTLLQRRRRGRTMTPPKERLPTPAFNL